MAGLVIDKRAMVAAIPIFSDLAAAELATGQDAY